ERNIASAFVFAQELRRAREIQDVLRLQGDYIKRQMQVLTEQARELGEGARREHQQGGKGRGCAETLMVACCEPVQVEKRLVQPTLDCAAQYFCCIAPNERVYHPQQTAVAFPMSGRRHGPVITEARIGCGRRSVRCRIIALPRTDLSTRPSTRAYPSPDRRRRPSLPRSRCRNSNSPIS